MNYQNHINYNCEITLDTGEKYRVYSQWLSNEDLKHWKGWECSAGQKRIYIINDNVYGGACRQDHLGKLSTGWEVLKNPTICQQEECSVNTEDLLIDKRKIDEDSNT